MKVLGIIASLCVALTAGAQEKVITLSSNNTITLNEEFTSESTAKVAEAARQLDSKLKTSGPIYLVLNTPGGEIFAGLEMIENLNSLSHRVDTITIFAASMGFQTVQQLKGNRYIVGNGTLMSHKARGGVDGEFPGQLDQRYSYILNVVTEMDRKDAARSKKHTLKSYRDLVENEFWCGPAACAEQGFVDAKVTVVCDKSLSGTHDAETAVSFFGMNLKIAVTLSDCPTITGPLAVKVNPGGGESEESFTRRLNRDQREVLTALKASAVSKFTNLSKRVVYTKVK